jgi:hypothetical protein
MKRCSLDLKSFAQLRLIAACHRVTCFQLNSFSAVRTRLGQSPEANITTARGGVNASMSTGPTASSQPRKSSNHLKDQVRHGSVTNGEKAL